MPNPGLTTQIEKTILQLRGQRVILDFQLSELYGVETRTLKQAVRRNLDRFPDDFMFELTTSEVSNLKSQFVISSSHGGSHDGQFRIVFDAIRQLMTPPSKPSREMGFHTIPTQKNSSKRK